MKGRSLGVAALLVGFGISMGLAAWCFGVPVDGAERVTLQICIMAVVSPVLGPWVQRRRLGLSKAERQAVSDSLRRGTVPEDGRLREAMGRVAQEGRSSPSGLLFLAGFCAVGAVGGGVIALAVGQVPVWRVVAGLAVGVAWGAVFLAYSAVLRDKVRRVQALLDASTALDGQP